MRKRLALLAVSLVLAIAATALFPSGARGAASDRFESDCLSGPPESGPCNHELVLSVEGGKSRRTLSVTSVSNHFAVSAEEKGGGAETSYVFRGELEPRGLQGSLVRYHLAVSNRTPAGGPSDDVNFEGSAVVTAGSRVVLGRSGERSFRLAFAENR